MEHSCRAKGHKIDSLYNGIYRAVDHPHVCKYARLPELEAGTATSCAATGGRGGGAGAVGGRLDV
jgi:hypothetical protein